MLKITGTTAGLAGAFLVAGGFFLVGYLAFLLSSFCWMLAALDQDELLLLTLNLGFFVANVYGLFNLGV